MALPWIALTLGDPAGIGPEIALAAIADERVRRAMNLLVIGPERYRPASYPPDAWVVSADPGEFHMGQVQLQCGKAALSALHLGHQAVLAGRARALVTGPVSKEALHLAGEKVEGQTELLGRWCGVTRFEMVALAGALRVMLLTRHMPLRAALDCVTQERVLDRLLLFHESLERWGFPAPRLALAGLNPHAGENGVLGREDLDVLVPAVQAARAQGLQVLGPLSPDTVFLQASQGHFDGVLALYHDQAFIPVKLLSAEGGVTALAGLPYLRLSPVHGTAFDIAGQGRARPENLIQALLQAAAWAAPA